MAAMTVRVIATTLIAALLTVGGVADAASQSSDQQNRRVRIHNQTGLVLQSLQAADVRTGDFRPDLLGGAPIPTGESRPVLIDNGANGCLYDLKVGLAGGQTLVRENVNVCRIGDYYLTR